MRSRPGGVRALFTRPYAWVWAVLAVWAVGWGVFAGRESVLFSWGFFVKAGSVPGLLIAGVLVWRGATGAALLAVLAVRLGLDPETYQYYSGGAILAALAADRTFGHRTPWATASVLLLVWLPAKLSGIPASTEGVVRLVWAGGILLLLLVAAMPRAGAGWTRIPVRPAAATDAEGALIS